MALKSDMTYKNDNCYISKSSRSAYDAVGFMTSANPLKVRKLKKRGYLDQVLVRINI